MRRWPFLLVVLGLALQIAAWILIIPPYGTYDEFDHVYRASGVWHGRLREMPEAPPGYPQAIVADRRLVEAGAAECLHLPYTSATRCNPGPSAGHGTVVVTSGAARYNPLYYLLVSPSTILGSGMSTVLWMRVWSCVITLAVLGWSVLLLRRWTRPAEGLRGLMVAFTPMVAVSCAIVAPNGLEMAAGLLWWVGLLTVTDSGRSGRPPDRSVWLGVAAAGTLLALLRSLGPLFLVVTLAVVVAWRGPALRQEIRRARRAAVLAASAVGLSLVVSAAWVLTQHAKSFGDSPIESGATPLDALRLVVDSLPGWFVQFVAAVPGRNIPPPSLVTAAWLVPLALLALNARFSTVRSRWAVTALSAVVLGFPVAFTVLTFREFGAAWQSRYILPLALGLPLMFAALGRRVRARLLVNDLVLVAGALTAGVVVARFAQHWYADSSPLITVQGSFPVTGAWVPVTLLVVGVGLVSLVLLQLSGKEPDDFTESGAETGSEASGQGQPRQALPC